MTLLKVSTSGQVYDIELPAVKVTRDQAGGYYVHGRGHWDFYDTFDEAEDRRRELESRFGGRFT